MIWGLIVLVGFLSMYQGGLNRSMAVEWGLPGAVLMNALVFLAASVLFFLGIHWGLIPSTPLFQNLAPFQKLKPWHILPGLFGFAFVLGIPLAISRVGAELTFIVLVVAQVAAGASWDYFAEAKPMTSQKWIGIAIACAGVWIALRKK